MRSAILKKQSYIDDLKKELNQVTGFVLIDYQYLDVQKISSLRKRLKDKKSRFLVVKNSLLRRAIEDKDYLDSILEFLKFQTAIVFLNDEFSSPLKVLFDFINETKLLKIKCGILEGRFLSPEKLKEFSKLPTRKELLLELLNSLNLPLAFFYFGCYNIINKFLSLLTQIKEIKENK